MIVHSLDKVERLALVLDKTDASLQQKLVLVDAVNPRLPFPIQGRNALRMHCRRSELGSSLPRTYDHSILAAGNASSQQCAGSSASQVPGFISSAALV